MRVIISGVGEVGSNIAAGLADTHEVVVIDPDPAKIEEVRYSIDVLAIEGSGTSVETLREAGIEQADMVIASANADETNLTVCATAKVLADPFTIARVKSVDYLTTWEANPGAYDVDYMVCTDLLTAEDIVRVLGLPSASHVASFASGMVRMAEFPVPEGSDIADTTVAAADQFDGVTFAALRRNGESIIARGDTRIEAGDKLVLIGTPDGIEAFAFSISPEGVSTSPGQVMIMGGSRVGYHTAQLLEGRSTRTRLIEQDSDRARELAEALSETTVFEHDATDVDFLLEERIGEVDAVVTTLANDEQNLLMAVLAKQLGADRAIAVVQTGAYAGFFEAVGIDVAVNPREIIAEEIVRFVHDARAEKISMIEENEAQVLELEITEESRLADSTVETAATSIDGEVVFGAITRDGEYLIPRGDTVISVGDHVVLFVLGDLESVTDQL